MPSVETIYQESVMPLPVDDQMRLAELIMKRATPGAKPSNGSRSVLDFLESVRKSTATRNAADIDEQIRAERDSWND